MKNILPSLARLAEVGWRDAGSEDPGPYSPTYPSRSPDRRIDTVLLGGGSEALRCRVAAPWGSDHRAVIVDFVP